MAFWTVRTYYKKSIEQHEHYVQRDGKGRITVLDGYRSCEFRVETEDDKFPEFEFIQVPGGDGKCDSLDMYSCSENNIVGSEMLEMFDGGCWGDTEIEGIDDEAEVERLEEFISEEGAYALEDNGDWYLSDTEVYVWGPLVVTNDDTGEERIICADANGIMVDFETDPPVVEEVTEQELLDDLEALKAEFEELMDSMPLPTEEKSLVTDWYPVDINPVRNGTYQIIESELEEKWPFPSNVKAAVWDGTKWDNTEVVMWRGLTEEVK